MEGRGPNDIYLGIHFGEVLVCGESECVEGEEVNVQSAAVEKRS